MPKIQRVLISVTDKSGIGVFARGLAKLGCELISTGGTARLLRDEGLPVIDVAEVTGFPEMLDGRVKTIHPRIAAGVLAMREKPEHMAALAEHGIPKIDMVVVNLYDFETVAANPDTPLEELIENIDIGGPTMIRAAAKNYQDVAVVTSPLDYRSVYEEMLRHEGVLSTETTWKLARKAFALTASYDRAIVNKLNTLDPPEPPVLDLRIPLKQPLRYGENPHQSAALYSTGESGVAGGFQLQGKELSYNNFVDLDAAWQLILEFNQPACAIIKHTNPCGCAVGDTLKNAYLRAYEADPVSAFGGVLAFNRQLDGATAEEVVKLFVEAIAAPAFSDEAMLLLAQKKNLRLLRVVKTLRDEPVVKSISGGYLVQSADHLPFLRGECKVVTSRAPTEEEWDDLLFGWRVVKHVKSNAIAYVRHGQLLAAGAGQMSRVDSVKFGAAKAILPLKGSVLASDAFFPFPDGIEEAAKHGVTAVIQPGGSVRDPEVIEAADRLGLAMVTTGVRHFRH
jgi:phosphoribosylaminoimidazolecarboxamide formyltransferase/IMP cyclohydrolase